jgi:phosphopantothenoylcysteine synthetase/decarboxylase
MKDRPVVYIVTCATLAATEIGTLVELAQGRGWETCVIVTPKALKFIDRTELEERTGYPVRSEYKEPGTPDVLPKADAVIVAGASFNTVNKWALGITDNLALGIIAEAPGLGLPVVLLPFVNKALAQHPAYAPALETLHKAGVTVLSGPEVYEPHPDGTGNERLRTYPWHLAVEVVEAHLPKA